MKRDEAEDDDGELGRAARRARTEPDGRLAAAVELAIDTDDDVDAAETDGATDADLAADEADVVPVAPAGGKRVKKKAKKATA